MLWNDLYDIEGNGYHQDGGSSEWRMDGPRDREIHELRDFVSRESLPVPSAHAGGVPLYTRRDITKCIVPPRYKVELYKHPSDARKLVARVEGSTVYYEVDPTTELGWALKKVMLGPTPTGLAAYDGEDWLIRLKLGIPNYFLFTPYSGIRG